MNVLSQAISLMSKFAIAGGGLIIAAGALFNSISLT